MMIDIHLKRFVSALFIVLACVFGLTGIARADLLGDLTNGEYVLMIRHADAPGVGDPGGYKLDQCATQRR